MKRPHPLLSIIVTVVLMAAVAISLYQFFYIKNETAGCYVVLWIILFFVLVGLDKANKTPKF